MKNRRAWSLTLLATLFSTLVGCMPQTATGLNIVEIRKAAAQGDADAQYQLGVMYGQGEGVPKNNVDAYAWLSLAAAQGDGLAARDRETVAHRLTSRQRNQAEAQASKLELQAKIDKPRKRSSYLGPWPSSSQPSVVATRTLFHTPKQ